MSQKRVSVKRINAIVFVIFMVILVISTLLQMNNNRKSAYMACDMLMDRVEEVIDRNAQNGEDIEEFIDKMPYTDTMTLYLFPGGMDSFIPLDKEPGKRVYSVEHFDEVRSYMVSENYGDYSIAVTYPVNKANRNVGMLSMVLFLALGLALIIINFVVSKAFGVMEKSRAELEETNKIVANAGFGTWNITLEENKKPRMRANAKMKEVLGVEGKDMSEEDIYEFWYSRIPKDELPSVRASVGEMLSGKVSENTYQWLHPSKGLIYVRCGGAASTLEKDMQILGGYHSDVTDIVLEDQKRQNELRVAKEEAERANAAKTNFLSRMSHDIRTPLNGILGLLRIDDMHEDDKELLKANREKITIAANHLLSLINDVLQMSKLEDGQINLAHEALDMKQLALDVMTIVSMRASEAGVTVENQTSNGLLPHQYVYGSPVHLRQLFLNIYSNAIKYNKVGGSVSTDFHFVEKKGNVVVYQWIISDTGIGMSREFLEHIFEPFAQERSDARSIYKGTGLGMAIVKSLVDEMHGTIEVTSKEDVGSSFTVTLPFEIADKKDVVQKKENIKNADISGLQLLLVEDNELNAEIAQIQLEEAGAKVTVVRDGKQAVEMFKNTSKGTFDAILMDIMMPVMDGLSATRAIRILDRPDAKEIPIIAMSANAFEEDVKKSIDAGMNAHLSKPLKMDLVIATIAQCCDK